MLQDSSIDQRVLRLRQATAGAERTAARPLMNLCAGNAGPGNEFRDTPDQRGFAQDWNQDWTQFNQWINSGLPRKR
jgi:hypothetical protein